MDIKAMWDLESNKGQLCIYKDFKLVSVVVPEVELPDREEFESWARVKANEIRKATSQPTKVNEVTHVTN